MATVAPYGSWKSPISAGMVAAGRRPLDAPRLMGGDVYWVEGRPTEGGRYVLMRQRERASQPEQLTPDGFNVRTRVHEYGGGAYAIHGETVFFVNFADQRLYRHDPGAAPRPITAEGPRFADLHLSVDGRHIYAVRERHGRGEAVNDLVVLPSDGSGEPRVLASGRDFYAFPRLSPDGKRLAWTCWDHPNLPWDGTELWVGDADASNARLVAGGPEESVFQPGWGPDGALYWVSDKAGWWQIYRDGQRLIGLEAEFGTAQWVFGLSTYAFLGDGRIACLYSQDGFDDLALLEPGGQVRAPDWPQAAVSPGAGTSPEDVPVTRLRPLQLPYTAIAPTLQASGSRLAFIGATPSEAAALVLLDVPPAQHSGAGPKAQAELGAAGRTAQARQDSAGGTAQAQQGSAGGMAQAVKEVVLRRSIEQAVHPAYVSEPRAIAFPTEGGLTAHAVFYPPANRDYAAPEGERPPLLVLSHGGPTSAAKAGFDLGIQYWTSRGFAVVDVNYGGSTGYGRAYRQRLNGQWGIVDVRDCVNAARYLAEQGEVDGQRLAIRGGSAGGYTTLCALVFYDDFSAGASYYGVADCELLATDTHKFEARYLDRLIGPYPEEQEKYRQRSPIHYTDRLSCPVILFQGLEDKIVPPSQAEAMVEALKRKGLRYEYLAFEGEQHGFRKAETIQRTLEAELGFYAEVFGFTPAGA